MHKPDEHVLLPNALFELQYVHDARISPDGARVAYVTSRTDEDAGKECFELKLVNLSTGQHTTVDFPGQATFPRWSPDGLNIAFLGTASSTERLYLCDASGGRIRVITPATDHVQGAPDWSPDSATLVYAVVTHRKQQPYRRITMRVYRAEELGWVKGLRSTLCIVDIASCEARALEVGYPVATQPLFSPCGERILFFGSDAAVADEALVGGLRLVTVELADSSRVEVLGERWFIAAAAWSPCGRRIVIAGAYNSSLLVPMSELWVVNRDGSDPECRTKNVTGNVGFRMHHDMPTWATSQNYMLCVPEHTHAYVSMMKGGRTEICRVTLQGDLHCEDVITGARSCLIMDVNRSTAQIVYCACDLISPWELYISGSDGSEVPVTKLNALILEKWPAMRVEHLKFQSKDGMTLEGWFLARATSSGPQPTVLFIHGGPMLAVGHAFRFDLHLLAANGYAVLFSNFRGSSGYGEAFMQAIAGDWGSRACPDHLAALDAAVARGLADPQRCGVWGPSHGGFAACWLVTHTHRFRAALAESAVTNFSTLYYLSDAPDLFVKDLGGRPDEIPDIYRSRSPLSYARFCRTPTLMMHGENDLRCPMAEAEQFYRALHDAGCPAELVQIPEMTHMGDSTGPLSVRRAQNEVLLEWFERHL